MLKVIIKEKKTTYFLLEEYYRTWPPKVIADSLFYHSHHPLPINQNQSSVTPAKIPPRRNNTNKFPKAFCSGPYKHKIKMHKINQSKHEF